jgi:hypothetical protein
MSEDFLSRWSRRKDEARRAGRGTTPQSDEAMRDKPETTQLRADDPKTRAAEPALTPEEIAALPKLNELTADTDITVFLRRGVPEGLRNAALRRMWMLDPAIRDFVGHARDYAYDWNTPGGVPGSGTIRPDDAAAMARHLFGGRDAAPSEEFAAEASRDETAAAHSPGDRPTAAAAEESAGEEEQAVAGHGTETAGPIRQGQGDG